MILELFVGGKKGRRGEAVDMICCSSSYIA